ncbi:hypothetical protein ACIPLC_26550 [Kitasatospora sp. NPDC086801]|uniref:hypothetical protein n=1 Tax=Kitasatospora sp. NPDC086801 TaxID=3364066 RepID=UPI00380FBF05
MLTVATKERRADIHSWTPYEDRAALSGDTVHPGPATPTMITIGDGYNQQVFACPVAPEHPHAARMQ